jgi:hypothetical protein
VEARTDARQRLFSTGDGYIILADDIVSARDIRQHLPAG